MNRILRYLILSGLSWLLIGTARAQLSYEVSCGAGSANMEGPTYNPSTNKLRSWLCVDAFGNVTSPVFASGTCWPFNVTTGNSTIGGTASLVPINTGQNTGDGLFVSSAGLAGSPVPAPTVTTSALTGG